MAVREFVRVLVQCSFVGCCRQKNNRSLTILVFVVSGRCDPFGGDDGWVTSPDSPHMSTQIARFDALRTHMYIGY